MTRAREDLLARVVDDYASHGIHDTSLRTLAAAIGASQRMLHYHFGSRDDVLAAGLEAIAGQQGQQVAAKQPTRRSSNSRRWFGGTSLDREEQSSAGVTDKRQGPCRGEAAVLAGVSIEYYLNCPRTPPRRTSDDAYRK